LKELITAYQIAEVEKLNKILKTTDTAGITADRGTLRTTELCNTTVHFIEKDSEWKLETRVMRTEYDGEPHQ
jgi:hypothetical protein